MSYEKKEIKGPGNKDIEQNLVVKVMEPKEFIVFE